MRSNIDIEEENMVFTGAPIKPFRSTFGSMVNHLTYVATMNQLIVHDSDGNVLTTLNLETPFNSKPVKIVRSNMVNDPAFYVITETDFTQFRCRLEDDLVHKGAKVFKVITDWTKTFEQLELKDGVKYAHVSRTKKGSRLFLLDNGNNYASVGKDGKVDEVFNLGDGQFKKVI